MLDDYGIRAQLTATERVGICTNTPILRAKTST